MIYDLIVAGAGASGMTAAICATDADIYKQFQHKADQTRKRSVLTVSYTHLTLPTKLEV